MTKEKTKDWQKFRNEVERQIEEDMVDDGAGIEVNREHSALEHPSYEELEEKLTRVEQESHKNWEEAQKNLELALRAKADLENFSRRMETEVKKAHLFGQTNFVKSLLDVADSLEQALIIAEKNKQNGMYEGLQLTMKLLMDAFSKQGVEEINPLHEPFNPHDQEAMSMVSDPQFPDNTVVNVFQKGYKIADRVIRPARVIVARNNSTEN